MRLMTKRVKVAENNFTMVEVGSVIIHNLQHYDVYKIEGGPWPCLKISTVSRKDNKPKHFNLTVDQVDIELRGVITIS